MPDQMKVRSMKKRDFLGIVFECCKVYGRAYINDSKTAYTGNCPKCYKPVEIKIVEYGGSRDRFFKVG